MVHAEGASWGHECCHTQLWGLPITRPDSPCPDNQITRLTGQITLWDDMKGGKARKAGKGEPEQPSPCWVGTQPNHTCFPPSAEKDGFLGAWT